MVDSIAVFGVTFHLYGLIVGLAILATVSVSEKVMPYIFPNGEVTKKMLHDSFWWILPAGLLGARLYHVWDYWPYYQSQPQLVLAVWQGGLGIYGGLIGGVVGAWLFSFFRRSPRQQKILFWGILDALSVGMLLGQAIGRVGNFVNQELYGKPSTLPWALYIDAEHRLPGYEREAYYHPLFAYESMWNLIGFYLFYKLARSGYLQSGKGNYVVVYLFWYALGRSALEFFRIERWEVGILPVASLLGVVIMIGTSLVYLRRRYKHEWSMLVD